MNQETTEIFKFGHRVSFAVSRLQPNRTSGIVGTGVTVQFASRWRALANYDVEVRGGSVAHVGSGGIKVIW